MVVILRIIGLCLFFCCLLKPTPVFPSFIARGVSCAALDGAYIQTQGPMGGYVTGITNGNGFNEEDGANPFAASCDQEKQDEAYVTESGDQPGYEAVNCQDYSHDSPSAKNPPKIFRGLALIARLTDNEDFFPRLESIGTGDPYPSNNFIYIEGTDGGLEKCNFESSEIEGLIFSATHWGKLEAFYDWGQPYQEPTIYLEKSESEIGRLWYREKIEVGDVGTYWELFSDAPNSTPNQVFLDFFDYMQDGLGGTVTFGGMNAFAYEENIFDEDCFWSTQNSDERRTCKENLGRLVPSPPDLQGQGPKRIRLNIHDFRQTPCESCLVPYQEYGDSQGQLSFSLNVYNISENTADLDGDGLTYHEDADIDGDGVMNWDDVAPFDNSISSQAEAVAEAIKCNHCDTDEDGMVNSFERRYGLDRTMDDANGDFDDDGYSNIEEYEAGTDPSDADSFPSDGEICAS